MKDPVLRDKVEHYLVSTQQDGKGIATGRRSTDGSLYKSRIVEFTDAIMQLISDHDKQLIARIKEQMPEKKRTEPNDGDLYWTNQGFNTAIDQVHQILDGMEQKK